MNRKAGVLMPVSSLPGMHGIGDFGKCAYDFIDAIAEAGVQIWQILPLNPLGYGNSPYQSCSAFAGDELYISLVSLVEEGLLAKKYLHKTNCKGNYVDYETVKKKKHEALCIAHKRFLKDDSIWKDEYEEFCKKAFWLPHYALFMAIRHQYGGVSWTQWQTEDQKAFELEDYDDALLQEQIHYHYFVQFLFYRQWKKVKTYANAKHIKIMGDIPIYLGLDSADVWEHRSYFLLDKKGKPRFVAGVPPDFFSWKGQRWGNPIYHWKNLKANRYDFWIDRLRWNQELYDIIRIDHFRAFDDFWQIPASCPTAIEGKWVLGPRHDFFHEVFKQLPDIEIVVEDLGIMRKKAFQLRDDFHLMGMKVIQFDLDETDESYLTPDRKHLLIYTDTHDNPTIRSWYESSSQSEKKHTRAMLKKLGIQEQTIAKSMIHFVMASNADFAIIPVWDLLNLGEEARFNVPSTLGSPNWEWRLSNNRKLKKELIWFKQVIHQTNRDKKSV